MIMLPSILSLLTYAAFASAIEPATNYENSALLSALDQASAGPSKTVIGGFANLSSLGIPALNTLFSNTTLDPNCQTDGGPCITSLNVGASKFSGTFFASDRQILADDTTPHSQSTTPATVTLRFRSKKIFTSMAST